MTTRVSSFGGSRLLLGVGAAALMLLGGCVVAPVDPYYDVGTPVTSYPYGPTYVAPVYPAYQAPYYYGPPLSLGIYGDFGRDRHRGGWDRPSRPGWGSHNGPRPGWGSHNGPRPGWDSNNRPRPGQGARPPGGSGGHGSGSRPSNSSPAERPGVRGGQLGNNRWER